MKLTSKKIVISIIEDFKNNYDNPNEIVAYWENKIERYTNSRLYKIIEKIKKEKVIAKEFQQKAYNGTLTKAIEIIKSETK